jgi:hypothetical protein
MNKVTRSKSVPKNTQARYDQIVGLTDEFCQQHLNEEYRELAQDMAAVLCRKRPSLSSGPAVHDDGRCMRGFRCQPEHRGVRWRAPSQMR